MKPEGRPEGIAFFSSTFQVQSRASLDRAQAAEEEQAKWQDTADQLKEQLRPAVHGH